MDEWSPDQMKKMRVSDVPLAVKPPLMVAGRRKWALHGILERLFTF